MQKEQKAVLNKLKSTILNEFEFARYVRREGNAIKFFVGTWKSAATATNPGFTKQQIARGWFPLGVELDLTKYKQFLDALQIPGLNVEIIWTISAGVKIPEIVATL
jgi:hypothetical protein